MVKKRHGGKSVIMILVAALATTGIIFLLFHADSELNEKNRNFLQSYGWQVEEEPLEICHLTIPEEFDQVFSTYHELCLEGGFDLEAYRGKPATRYTYRVINHENSQSGLVHANLLVIKDTIIAADICSMEPDGFLQSITDSKGQIP